MGFDMKRLSLADQLAGGGAILLFIFFCFFDWYGVSFGSLSAGVSGWTALELLRWLILLTVIVAIGLVVMKATAQNVDLPVAPGLILLVLSGLTLVFTLWR